jgi:hypothetical protein
MLSSCNQSSSHSTCFYTSCCSKPHILIIFLGSFAILVNCFVIGTMWALRLMRAFWITYLSYMHLMSARTSQCSNFPTTNKLHYYCWILHLFLILHILSLSLLKGLHPLQINMCDVWCYTWLHDNTTNLGAKA